MKVARRWFLVLRVMIGRVLHGTKRSSAFEQVMSMCGYPALHIVFAPVVYLLGRPFREVDGGVAIGTLLLPAAYLVYLLLGLRVKPEKRTGMDPLDLLPIGRTERFVLKATERAVDFTLYAASFGPVVLGLSLAANPSAVGLASAAVTGLALHFTICAFQTAGEVVVPRFVPEWLRGIGNAVLAVLPAVPFTLYAFLAAHDFEPLWHPGNGPVVQDIWALHHLSALMAWEADHPLATSFFPPTWIVRGMARPEWALVNVLVLFALVPLLARLHHFAEDLAPASGSAPDTAAETGGLVAWLTARAAPGGVAALAGAERDTMLDLRIKLVQRVFFNLLVLAGIVAMMPLHGASPLGQIVALFTAGSGFLILYSSPLPNTASLEVARTLPLSAGQYLLARAAALLGHGSGGTVALIFFGVLLVPAPAALDVVAACAFGAIVLLTTALAVAAIGVSLVPPAGVQATNGTRLMAIGLVTVVTGPLLGAPRAGPFAGAICVIVSALALAGVWQKAVARLENMANPHRERSTLLGDAIIGALLLMGAQFPVLGAFVTMILAVPSLARFGGTPFIFAATAALQLLAIAGACVYAVRLPPEQRAQLPALGGRPSQWLKGIALGLCSAALVVAYTMSQASAAERGERAPVESGQEVIMQTLQDASQPRWVTVLVVLSISVLAPLSEELIFRRLLFTGLWRATGRVVTAGALTALLFAGVHPPQIFIFTFAIGSINAALVARNGTVAPALALHLTHNSLMTVVALAQGWLK